MPSIQLREFFKDSLFFMLSPKWAERSVAMNDKILIEIRDLLKKLVEMQSGNTSTEEPDIMSWIAEKNSEVQEVMEEKPEEATVIFEMLEGADSTGLEDFIGKPMSEVDMNVIKMIARPDYSKKFAPLKFPQEVIDEAIKLAE